MPVLVLNKKKYFTSNTGINPFMFFAEIIIRVLQHLYIFCFNLSQENHPTHLKSWAKTCKLHPTPSFHFLKISRSKYPGLDLHKFL